MKLFTAGFVKAAAEEKPSHLKTLAMIALIAGGAFAGGRAMAKGQAKEHLFRFKQRLRGVGSARRARTTKELLKSVREKRPRAEEMRIPRFDPDPGRVPELGIPTAKPEILG